MKHKFISNNIKVKTSKSMKTKGSYIYNHNGLVITLKPTIDSGKIKLTFLFSKDLNNQKTWVYTIAYACFIKNDIPFAVNSHKGNEIILNETDFSSIKDKIVKMAFTINKHIDELGQASFSVKKPMPIDTQKVTPIDFEDFAVSPYPSDVSFFEDMSNRVDGFKSSNII